MKRTIIIAEAGVNHNGDISIAKKLVDAAAIAGADYVKFQTFKANKLVSAEAKQAEYQQRNMKSENDSQLDMLKALELSHDAHYELKRYAEGKGIKFLSTGFDSESLDFLQQLGIDFFKIPSGEITNYAYLKQIAGMKKPVVVSTGMAFLEEVRDAVNVLLKFGVPLERISVLHCNTEYPTPMEDVNLSAMTNIGKELKVDVGYSDHTLGIEIPIAAVAMGAVIIEKHFTLDRTMEGPDHKASLEPGELIAMVSAIRNIEKSFGDGIKRPSASEEKNRAVARKSLFAAMAIKTGEIVTEASFIALRPGDGISPMRMNEFVGRKASCDILAGEKINESQFK